MCGIAGISSIENRDLRDIGASMNGVQRHRGPDDSGVWANQDGTLVLAHRRLSIIDLSSSGHQPMEYYGGPLTIVFNGEIYNFMELREELAGVGCLFRTSSDTEVILAAYSHWGEDCFKHFNGMFAFAIYDAGKDKLFLARDRAGEKPLFYWHSGNYFAFASELKGLMKCPLLSRRLDLTAMNFFLAYGYVPRDMCILEGVKKLVPGHVLILDRRENRLDSRAYWKLPEPEQRMKFDAHELVHELRTLLTDSVRHQLVADVPVGVLLSGGVDSSIVTALASEVSGRAVKTFTISFPDHAGFDESRYAQIVASHFGTEHTVLPAESASFELLPELARQYDEPLADSSMIPTYLVSKLVRQHAAVAIGGDGGDELFGGYFHYSWLSYQEQLRKFLPKFCRDIIAEASCRFLPAGFKGRSYLIGAGGPIERSFSFVNQFFNSRLRQRLFNPLRGLKHRELERPERYKGELGALGVSTVQKAAAVDFMTYLPDDILVKVDRASMLTSLEVRAPFLDYRIIEFAFSRVPDFLKIHGGQRKILPRLLAEDLLPKSLDLDRKQGFAIPLSLWFKGDWGNYMKSVILAPDACFNRSEVSKLIRNQELGLANSQRIFALTLFELWRKEYGISW
ncbi:MAG: asparagine synthase (glutamine-hydrolyzing) [Deltaproteobacteria bacterium]|nr:asparagine synthase (glutamine-hydrolyzing) [Deltaproteobacteria bacterium]